MGKFSFGLILSFLSIVQGFNLETRLPVIKRGKVGSYFGYSVAEHQSLEATNPIINNTLMLVGAPLGQNLQPKTNKSGALWKCPLTTLPDDCEQVITDGKRMPENLGGYNKSIDSQNLMPPLEDEDKNGQWMGVTVRSRGKGGKVMVCAHRYMRIGPEFRWGQGLCYTMSQYLDYEESWEPCKGRSVQSGHEQYGFCQAGTSALLLEDDMMLIGAPGPFTWRGTVYVVNVSDSYLLRDKTMYHGPVEEKTSPVDSFSYLGMSVTAAHFLDENQMIYAAGAPRSNGTGQVVLYATGRSTSSIMKVMKIISGEQFASSFGYEVATADVNGDKIPDLLVGAPFYFSRVDGGAVYVYVNQNYNLDTKPVRLTGKAESRFGFAIANLGDLNKDGFEDVAIGAPYEGKGAVYIYLGSKEGLIVEPSQVIHGDQFSGLQSLGHSLSGGLDMDENGYPDLLAGAYESDAVLLLRARPIVGLTTSLEAIDGLTNLDPNKRGCALDQDSNHTCFSFKACVVLESRVNLPRQRQGGGIELHYKLEVDHKRKLPRVWIGPDGENRSSVAEYAFMVYPDASGQLKNCQTHTVYLKENSRDIQSPIRLKRSYSLVDVTPEQPREGDPLPSVDNLPILNQQEADKVFMVSFLKDCGDNDRCESNLFVMADLQLPKSGENKQLWELMLGQHTEVVLNITAHNLAESAYEAQLFVSHPIGLSYIGRSKAQGHQLTCHPANETVVACSLGNPLMRGPPVELQLRFDPVALPDSVSQLAFLVWANSTSEQKEPQEPIRLLAAVVKRAELSLTGLARPEQVLYGGQVKGESSMRYKDEVGSRVLHTYQVFNKGPWRVTDLEVHIEWPFQVANNKPLGKWLLYMEDKPYIEALSGGECHMAPGQVNPLKLENRPGLLEQPLESLGSVAVPSTPPPPHNVTTAGVGGEPLVRRRRDAEMVVRTETITDKDGRKTRIVNMNCMLETAKCFKFSCTVYNLQKNQEATIFIRARLWNSTLVSDYPKVDRVSISSRAKIHIPKTLIIQQDTKDDVAQVETVCKVDLLEQQGAEPVPWWIIIVAIVIGLLVLILLTLLLWKLGFFKRRRPDPTLSGNLEKHRIDDHDY